jgi:hypothetical protein
MAVRLRRGAVPHRLDLLVPVLSVSQGPLVVGAERKGLRLGAYGSCRPAEPPHRQDGRHEHEQSDQVGKQRRDLGLAFLEHEPALEGFVDPLEVGPRAGMEILPLWVRLATVCSVASSRRTRLLQPSMPMTSPSLVPKPTVKTLTTGEGRQHCGHVLFIDLVGRVAPRVGRQGQEVDGVLSQDAFPIKLL